MPSLLQFVQSRLRNSVDELNNRCLFQSSKWACEQLIGMDVGENKEDDEKMDAQEILGPDKENDMKKFAVSLITASEFQRCSFLLKSFCSNCQVISNHLLFLKCYSLYMAGESIKSQQNVERSGTDATAPSAVASKQGKNPYLEDVYFQLLPLYLKREEEPSYMDGFLLYIFGVVVRDIALQGSAILSTSCGNSNDHSTADRMWESLSAYDILVESVVVYPWNWSCWLELAGLYLTSQGNSSVYQGTKHVLPKPLHDSQGKANRKLEGYNVMLLHFLGHVHIEQQHGQKALDCYKVLRPMFPVSHYIVTQIALAHYTLLDYELALEGFEVIRQQDPHRMDHMDTYSNILYVKELRADLSTLAHLVVKVNKFSPQSCCVVGNYYSLKGCHEKAVIYFRRALKLNAEFLSAWTLMGHEFVELRNTSAAVQCYRQAITLSMATDYRAWYGLGQTYEMLRLNQYALYYFKKAAQLRPQDGRMWCAIGSCYNRIGPSARSEAVSAFAQAVNCGDREGIATKELARLYKETGHLKKAAVCFEKFFSSCYANNNVLGAANSSNLNSSAQSPDREISDSLYLSGGSGRDMERMERRTRDSSPSLLGSSWNRDAIAPSPVFGTGGSGNKSKNVLSSRMSPSFALSPGAAQGFGHFFPLPPTLTNTPESLHGTTMSEAEAIADGSHMNIQLPNDSINASHIDAFHSAYPTSPRTSPRVAAEEADTFTLPNCYDAFYGSDCTDGKDGECGAALSEGSTTASLLPVDCLCAEVFGEIDSERAEAIVFMASYYFHHESESEASIARVRGYCSLLFDYHGPEGEEARRMLRDLGN